MRLWQGCNRILMDTPAHGCPADSNDSGVSGFLVMIRLVAAASHCAQPLAFSFVGQSVR